MDSTGSAGRDAVARGSTHAKPPRMNSRYLPAWMVCLPLLLAACGERRELSVEDYDQTCTKDDECVTVLVGEPCECSCDTAAINTGSLDEYTADATRIKSDCAVKAAKCAECPDLSGAICAAGKCAVENKVPATGR